MKGFIATLSWLHQGKNPVSPATGEPRPGSGTRLGVFVKGQGEPLGSLHTVEWQSCKCLGFAARVARFSRQLEPTRHRLRSAALNNKRSPAVIRCVATVMILEFSL